MKVEELIQSLPDQDFEGTIRLATPDHRDAYALLRLLHVSTPDLVKMCGRDIGEAGLRLGKRQFGWDNGLSHAADLRSRLLKLRSEVRPEERVFDSHKPIVKAAHDLRNGFLKAHKQWQHYGKEPAPHVDARLPGFLVLGAPKCATTWLYDCLAVHPDIYVPQMKELEYFGNDRYYMGMNWYKKQFVNWSDEKTGGDVSVGYFHSCEAPAQIFNDLNGPSLKMIVLLREPLSRAISYYRFRLLTGNAPRAFERALQMRYFRQLLIESGHYYRYYENYLKYFSRGQILILLYEEIQQDSLAALRKVFRFLDVDPDYYHDIFESKSNTTSNIRSLPLHYILLRTGMLFNLVMPSGGVRRRINRAFSSLYSRINLSGNHSSRPIDEAVYQRLREEFSPSNHKLSSLAGIDLSLWGNTSDCNL